MSRTMPCPRTHAALAACLVAVAFAPAARAQDLAVVAITQPVGGCVPLGTDNVTLRLFNYAQNLPAGTTFDVSYTVNGGTPVTEMVVLGSTLLENSTFTYTFTTQANLTVPGTYTLAASVNLAGDINPGNNAHVGYLVPYMSPSFAGTLTGPGAPSASGMLTLNGWTGAIAQWEESDDGGLRWYALANESFIQEYAGLRASTQFRVRVTGAPCGPDVLSNVVTVSP